MSRDILAMIENGPPHPRSDERFAVAYNSYPGGEDAYWKDFRAAAIKYYWYYRDVYPVPKPGEEGFHG